MAKETITRLVDDLGGGSADRTVGFSWDGNSYEIDLSKKNAATFEKAMRPYVDAARSVRGSSNGSGRRRAVAGRGSRRTDLQSIREWARANGHSVSDRGRVPVSIVDAYHAAQ